MRLISDLKFAIRMLFKNAAVSAVAIVVVGLGIGVNTTVFTFVNAVLLRGLPFENPEQILHLENANLPADISSMGVSYPDLIDWRSQTTSFIDLAGYLEGTMNISDQTNVPERFTGARITSNTFRLVGQQPLLGRDFSPREDRVGAEDVVILGFSIWQNRYAGDPDTIDQTLRVNEVPHVIIGVMPEGMRFPLGSDLWIPFKQTNSWESRDSRGIEVFGRLADGQTLETARLEMDGIAARLAEAHPNTNENVTTVVKTFNEEYNGGQIKVVFQAMMGAVGFVLLIACANVANLLLARSKTRAREMSIRAALGASRWHIVHQLLMESVLLSLLGGILGILLAYGGVGMFERAVASIDKPYWIVFTLDSHVIIFLLVICFATGIIFGLVPAWHSSRSDLNSTLQESGRGNSAGRRGQRFAATLVVGQIAMALLLLVGAGLMIRSLLNTYVLDLGIDSERLLTMRLGLAEVKYPEDEQRIVFHRGLHERLTSIPGVESVTVSSHVPSSGSMVRQFRIEGRQVVEDELPSERLLIVGQSYTQTLGVQLLSGRTFDSQDGRSGQDVIIISREFVERHFPGEDPVGRRIQIGSEADNPWSTIVGVVIGVRQNGPDRQEIDPLIFRPYRSEPLRFMWILARTQGDPHLLVDNFRAEVQKVDADLPVYNVQTLEEILERGRWSFRVFGTLFAIFALVALLMSAVGIYGVISYSVSQRTQEIGVRTALGATNLTIIGLVMKRGVLQLTIGMGLGLAAAFGVSRILASVLIRVSPTDGVTFGVVSLLLTIVTLGLLLTCISCHPTRSAAGAS